MINYNLSKNIDAYEVQSLLLLESLFKYDAVMRNIEEKPKVRVILLENVPVIDTTGLQHLNDFCKMCKKRHIKVILSGVSSQVLDAINKDELKELIGSDNIFQDTKSAFQKAERLSFKESS